MSLLRELAEIIEKSKREFEEAVAGEFEPVELCYGEDTIPSFTGDFTYKGNKLVRGDNVAYMKQLLDEGYGGKFKLIYIDPPFFSGNKYKGSLKVKQGDRTFSLTPMAYEDSWNKSIEEYLGMLCTRMLLMRELLSDDGSFWIHLDWHMVHYVKIILDEIFGEENFINEVVWLYKSGGSSKHHFSRKHDTLLFYKKSKKHSFTVPQEKSYNRGYKPYRFKGVKEYKDELGWYTMVNMKDVWQLDMVGRTSRERTGYATQKPEALLSRIVDACTEPGDLCGDFFCGAGTLAAVASKKERRWMACDMGKMAVATAQKRLVGEKANFLLECQKSDESDKEFSIRYDFSIEDVAVSDLKKISVQLKSYHEDFDEFPIDSGSTEEAKKLMHEDPLAFINYWSIDLNYNGKIQNPDATFLRQGDEMNTRYEVLAEESGDVSIRVVDIFGNSVQKILTSS